MEERPLHILKGLPVILSLAVGPAAGQEAASVAAGRKLALDVCAKCHVVTGSKSAPVLDPPAPSFAAIVARPEVTRAWLQAFLGNPHGETRRASSMPPFMLHPAEVDAAVAYLLSLKRE